MSYPSVPLRELLVLHDTGVWGPEDEADGISVLRSTNFSPDGSIRFENLTYRSIEPRKRVSKRLEPNDIILEKSGGGPKQPVGRVCLFRGHHIAHAFGNFTARLRVERTIVEPEFLFWCLRHLHLSGGTLGYQKHTSGIRNLETKRYLSHLIPLPPLDEQRRIIGILNRAAKIERLRARARELMREFIPALFIKMFGDPIENPKGWDEAALGDIGNLDRGRSRHRPRNAPELYGGPYPFVQTADVANSGGVIRQASQQYSELGLQQSKMWPAGTLCVTIAANIGGTGVLEFDACFPDSVVGFVPTDDLATVEYVQCALDCMQARIEENAPMAAQRNINLRILRSLRVPVPPVELQRRFGRAVRRARVTANVARQDASLLTASLMRHLLQGLIEMCNDER